MHGRSVRRNLPLPPLLGLAPAPGQGLRYSVWPADDHMYPKLRLKYKPNLISLAGGMEGLPITDPAARATPLEPAQWKDMIATAKVRARGRPACRYAPVARRGHGARTGALCVVYGGRPPRQQRRRSLPAVPSSRTRPTLGHARRLDVAGPNNTAATACARVGTCFPLSLPVPACLRACARAAGRRGRGAGCAQRLRMGCGALSGGGAPSRGGVP